MLGLVIVCALCLYLSVPGLALNSATAYSRVSRLAIHSNPLIHPSSSPHTHWGCSRATLEKLQHALIHDPPKPIRRPVVCVVVGWRLCRCHDTKQEMEATRMDLDASLLTFFQLQLRTWAPT